MDAIIQKLVNMSPESIAAFANYFFIALAVFAVLGFLFGMIRGLYRATSMFICVAICLVVIICFNSKITESVYNASASVLNIIPGKIEIPDGVNTVGEYFENIAKQFLENNNYSYPNSEEMSMAVRTVAICFVNIGVYFALLIATIIIAPLLDLIVYNLVFRLIIPRKARKKHKVRWAGGLITTVEALLCFTMFFAPITGLANSAVSNVRDENGNISRKELDNDYYNALMNVLEGYNKSAVAQMFFGIKIEDKNSFDVTLMDYVTKATTTTADGKTTIKTYSELGGLGALLVEALSTGAVNEKIDYTMLLTPAFVEACCNYFSKSVLVQTIVAIGATVASTNENFKDKVDLTGVDFFGIDWKDTSSAVNSVFLSLNEAGLFDDVTNMDERIKTLSIDSSNVVNFKDAVNTVGNSDLFNKIMPKLLVSYAKSVNAKKAADKAEKKEKKSDENKIDNLMVDIEMPEDEEFYSSIAWGKELSTLINIIYGISEQYYAYTGSKLYITNVTDAFGDDMMDILFGKDTVKEYTTLEQKYSNNKFINGGVYTSIDNENNSIEHQLIGVKGIFGVGNGANSEGFFDLQIVKSFIEKTNVIGNIFSNINLDDLLGVETSDGNEGNQNATTLQIKELVKDWNANDWKDEMKAICNSLLPSLDFVRILSDNTSGKNIFDCGEEIEYTFSTIDDSKIMKCLVPNLLNDVADDVLSFGEGENKVSPKFDNIENWADEGHYFRLMLDSIKDISASGLDNIDWMNIDNIETLRNDYEKKVSEGTVNVSFDKYYLDNSKVNRMLTNLYKTQSIGGKYNEDNSRTDGIFENILSDILKNSVSSISDSIDMDNCPEKDLIEKDFSLGDGKAIYTVIGESNVYVTWDELKINNESLEYYGEIANLSLLMGEISTFSSGDKTDLTSISGLLGRLNDSYLFRSMIPLVLNSEIGSLGSEAKFVEKADFDSFNGVELSFTPYKYVEDESGQKTIEMISKSSISNRSQEVENRAKEIKSITNIFDLLTEVNDALELKAPDGTDNFYAIKKLVANKELTKDLLDDNSLKNNDDQSLLERMLSSLKNSKIFNTPKYDDMNVRNDTTAFEYFFQYISSGEVFDCSTFLKNLDKDPSIIYSISNTNSWDDEIKNYNKGLYGIANNSLLNIIDQDFALEDLDDIIDVDNGKTPIEDLLGSMSQSILLSDSIGYSLDKNFLPEIMSNLGYTDATNYYIDNQAYEKVFAYYNEDLALMKNTLIDYGSYKASELSGKNIPTEFWKNEGKTLELIIEDISKVDLTSASIGDIDVDFNSVDTALQHSLCLNYLHDDKNNAVISSDTVKPVKSIYQHITIYMVEKIKDGFSDPNGLNIDVSNASVDNIKSYSKEMGSINGIIDSYKIMVDDLGGTDGVNITNENSATLATGFQSLLDSLENSDVFHVHSKISVSRNGKDLTVFEQLVSRFVNSANLDSSIYDSQNPLQTGCKNGKEVIDLRITQITENDKDNTLLWTGTYGEISKIASIIRNFSDYTFETSSDTDDSSYGLSNYIYKEGEEYKGTLPAVNNTYVLHDIVSTMTHQFCDAAKIDGDTTLLIRETSKYGYFIIDSDDTINFSTKVDKWNEELYKLIDIFDVVDEITKSDNIIEICASKPFENLLPRLANTTLFGNVVDEMFVSIFDQYCEFEIGSFTGNLSWFLKTNISENNLVTLENTDVTLGDEYSWKDEGKGIDLFIAGLPTFASQYVTYKLISSPIYPTYPNVDPGKISNLMATKSHLTNVFPE